jgi:putative membrane protein
MKKTATALVAFVAIEHLYILVLEMFLWTKPAGLRAFALTPEFAEQTAVLAANQGLYNGFLAAGLIWGLIRKEDGHSLQVFFLGCVIVAGIFGAITAKPSILYVQAAPAFIALVLTLLARRRLTA